MAVFAPTISTTNTRSCQTLWRQIQFFEIYAKIRFVRFTFILTFKFMCIKQQPGRCRSSPDAVEKYQNYGKSTECQGGKGGGSSSTVYKISGTGNVFFSVEKIILAVPKLSITYKKYFL